MNKEETYSIEVIIRTKEGKIVTDANGIKHPSIKLLRKTKSLKYELMNIHREFQTFMPTMDINIEASLYNTISSTYMTMASFYGSEKLFINH